MRKRRLSRSWKERGTKRSKEAGAPGTRTQHADVQGPATSTARAMGYQGSNLLQYKGIS